MDSMSQLRDWVEKPIINAMQLYAGFVKEGSISKESANSLLEEYGALICFLDTPIEDQKTKKMITTYRRDLINLAKNTIKSIGEEQEQKNGNKKNQDFQNRNQ